MKDDVHYAGIVWKGRKRAKIRGLAENEIFLDLVMDGSEGAVASLNHNVYCGHAYTHFVPP